jgi:hypothetical protein
MAAANGKKKEIKKKRRFTSHSKDEAIKIK